MKASVQGRCEVGAMALLAAVLGCYGVRATPGPSAGFEVVVTDTLRPSKEGLGNYLRSLTFDTNYAFGDKQRLMVGTYPNSHYGPLVTIQPEEGNYRLTQDDLRHGRIIARFINHSDEPYPKLGLAPHSVTYWWAQLGSDSTTNRSVMISTDSTGLIVSKTQTALHYEPHLHQKYHAGVARWFWIDADEQGWSGCGSACCKT
jgi:hypothetical protein